MLQEISLISAICGRKRTYFELHSKILTFENSQINLEFYSLIRIFASVNE